MAKDSSENCPICDSSLSGEERECPNCGAILWMFDLDVDINEGVPKESIERVKDLILEESEDEELLEDIKEMEFSDIVTDDEISSGEEEGVEEIVTFACPICDSEVGANDSQCPNCGAIFEEESDEEGYNEGEEDVVEGDIELEDTFLENEDEYRTVDFQDEIDDYQKRIDRFESSGLDMKYLKKDLSELKEGQEEGDEDKCERVSDKIQKKIEHVENIMRIINKCENFLSILSKKIDVSEMEKKIDKIYEGCEIGEYQVASKRAEDIQKDILGKLDEFEEKKWLNDLIEEKIKEANEMISSIESDIDIERIEEKIEGGISAKNEGEIDKSIHKVIDALNSASNVSKVSEKIREANAYLGDIKRRGIDAWEYTEDIDHTIKKIESGEEEAAFEIIEESIKNMQDRLERYERKEGETRELNKKIEERISEMKSVLERAEEFDITMSEGEEMIDEAERYKKENDYEEGLAKLEELEEHYLEKSKEKIEGRIDSLKEGVDEDIFEEEFPLDKVEELKEKNEYEKVFELIEETKKSIRSQKEIKDEFSADISKIERIIGHTENLDFEIEKVKKSLDKAKEKIEEEEWDEAEGHIQTCQETIKKKLVSFLKDEIKNAKKKLKDVADEDIDVTKPIDFLKKANRAKKENDLEESFEALKNYKEEMERIVENT
ncbi:MAG: hypothetical protein KGY66_00155 [Candidatus Thermoplasmatota archaeon]|nr:hypothetical protein [Candidatus Thermoplasmatota archaeon]MBS3789315.1 hypothetical protein [Candidatus Thermoplasmatota archaeon]